MSETTHHYSKRFYWALPLKIFAARQSARWKRLTGSDDKKSQVFLNRQNLLCCEVLNLAPSVRDVALPRKGFAREVEII